MKKGVTILRDCVVIVTWNDPDGSCSRVLVIETIEVRAGVAVITEPDGSLVECYTKELS